MQINLLRQFTLAILNVCLLTACGGGGSDSLVPEEIVLTNEDLADARVYLSQSTYSEVIVQCIQAREEAELCSMETLPLLGMEFDNPTVSEVMERVVVSHSWMGERFQQLLTQLPADMLLLLKGVTAIVIDDDVRPSYYTTSSGAIFINPAKLWLSNEEKATINPKEDYRSGFSNELAFRSYWQYVLNGQDIHISNALDGLEERGLNDIIYSVAATLYHELAHVNDFFNPQSIDGLDRSLTINAAAQLDNEQTAQLLASQEGLSGSVLYELADVMFAGDTATAAQKAMTALDVAGEFEMDFANDHYAYSSIYEDVAMLFEESMMKHHFNIDRDVIYLDVVGEAKYCNEYTMSWGLRNRLGDNNVKLRAQLVVGELLPSVDLSLFFQNLTLPRPLAVGHNLCSPIHLAAPGNVFATMVKDSPSDAQKVDTRGFLNHY